MTKRLRSIVPLAPARVASEPYIVQPGDSVERITAQFTRPDRWPGLVGANVHHKALADEEGQAYAVFDSLTAGEPLLIPASWLAESGAVAGPLSSGVYKPPKGSYAEAGSIDPASALVQFVVTNWNAILAAIQSLFPSTPAWSVPVNPATAQPYTPEDIGKVIAGFIPYVVKMPPGTVLPPFELPQSLPINPIFWIGPTTGGVPTLLAGLAKSATELLSASKAPSGDILSRVPWDVVPWTVFPWSAVRPAGNWTLFQGSLQAPSRGATYMRPSMRVATTMASNYTPGFLVENWQSSPWTDVPWTQVAWPSIDPSIFNDPSVQKCMQHTNAANRLQQMLAYRDCFVGKGAAKFAKYLCPTESGGYEELSGCMQDTPPGPCGPGQTMVNGICVPSGAEIPPWFATVNWNCQPFPACIAQQVPAGQEPCSPWPDCFASYLQSLGITGPAEPAQPEKKGMSTGAKVIIGAAAAGGLALIYSIARKAQET